EWAPRFAGGSFATIYLAPYNYHRIHMPADGTLKAAWFVPGRLFSVSALAARKIENLFARNERVVLLFESAAGPFAVIFVGALNVGSMATVWHGDVAARRPRVVTALPLPPAGERFRARRAAAWARAGMATCRRAGRAWSPPRRCRLPPSASAPAARRSAASTWARPWCCCSVRRWRSWSRSRRGLRCVSASASATWRTRT